MRILLFSLLVFTLFSCKDPLDKVYEPLSLRTDYREIEEKYGSQEADKITYVLDRDNPAIGATYREIIEDYPRVFQIQKTEDSLLRATKLLVESIKKERELAKEKLELKWKREAREREKNHKKNRRLFIKILDEYTTREVYRNLAIEEYDGLLNYSWMKDFTINKSEVSIEKHLKFKREDLVIKVGDYKLKMFLIED